MPSRLFGALHGVDVKIEELSELKGSTDLVNLLLLFELDVFESDYRSITDLRLPVTFAFTEKNILSICPKNHSRSVLVAFYLNQAIMNCELSLEFSKNILVVGIRILMGLRLDSVSFPTCSLSSEPVTVLVLVYRLIAFWGTMKKQCGFLKFSANIDSVLDTFVLHRSANEMDKIEAETHFLASFREAATRIADLKLFMKDMEPTNVGRLIVTLLEVSKEPMGLLGTYLVGKLSVVARSKRERLRARALRHKALTTTLPMCENFHSLIWQLPVELGKEGLKEHEDHFKINLIVNYFQFKKLGREFLSDIENGWKNLSLENRKNLMSLIVQAGLHQWLEPQAIAPALISNKGTEHWWASFRGNVVRLFGNEFDETVYCILLNFFAKNHFAPMQIVESTIVGSVLRSFTKFLLDDQVAMDMLFTGYEDESAVIQLLQTIKGPSFLSERVEIMKTKDLISEICLTNLESVQQPQVQFLGNLLGTRNKQLKYKAKSSIELCELTNIYKLKSMIETCPEQIFAKMFIFNMNAFLETEKMQKLATNLLHVKPEVYAHVLHYAGMAYCNCGEREGALSILKRLVEEYKYPDSWRLASRLELVSGDLLVGAIALCPENKLADLINLMQPTNRTNGVRPTRSKHIPHNEYIHSFPNLDSRQQVDSYMHLIGASETEQVSFEMAEFISRLPSLTDQKMETLISGLHKAAMMAN